MTTVAVLGGGQLGWMLGQAAIPLGVQCRFLDPVAGAPAGRVGPLITGALDDAAALATVATGADVITYEWEGVPAEAAARAAVAAEVPLRPGSRALATAQDRLLEKQLFTRLGIEVADFAPVDDRGSLDRAVARIGLPAVLKTRQGGYDGKGQYVLRDAGDVDTAFAALHGHALVLERHVPFERELSVLAARGLDGRTRTYPLVENRHAGGILRVSRAPAPGLTTDLQAAGETIAIRLLDDLDYVGVIAVELFEHGGHLIANEMAPRVHNSGHWTIEGAETSQFEQHLRAILGWPLGSSAARGASVMVNCIGEMPDRDAILAIEGAHLHDYGKAPRAGRKLGHVTITAATAELLDDRAALVERLCSEPAT